MIFKKSLLTSYLKGKAAESKLCRLWREDVVCQMAKMLIILGDLFSFGERGVGMV